MHSSSALCSTLLLLLCACPATVGQPYGMLSWVHAGPTTSAVTYTLDGGRTFSNLTTGSFQFGLSSPMGGTCLVFYQDSGSMYWMRSWNPVSYTWQTYSPGLPATIASIYVGDMNINRAAWLGVNDSTSGWQVYTWANGRVPFNVVPSAASPFCAGYQLGAMGSLPSLNALAAMAVSPYYLSLWRSTGCQGVLDLTGSSRQVWSIASTSTSNPYSITAYSVLMAAGPVGCSAGAACLTATAGGRLYAAVVAGANDAALLTAGAWSSFAMPNGGGVNLVGCYFTLATTSPAYCFAAASWNPPVTVYSGSCSAASSGYSFYTALNSNPVLAASWAEVGCAPIIPQSMAILDYSTIHLAGFALGTTTVAVVYSADSGATWFSLAALPDYVVNGGTEGAGLKVLQMAYKGGPVLISGMDPVFHCSGATNNYKITSTCNKATLLAVTDCNSMLKISTVAMAVASRGTSGSAVILGTFQTSDTSVNLDGSPFAGWMITNCNGWSTTYYSSVYTSALYPQEDGGGTITDFFNALRLGTINPRLIIITEVNKGAFGIQQTDMTVIDRNVLALSRFVSTGGGLYVLGFQGPSTGITELNFGYLTTLTPSLVTKKVNGYNPVVTTAGTSNFPTLTSSDISSPWHTSFGGSGYGTCTGCSFGVLSCLATETLSSEAECALVGGSSISFNYGTQSQSIVCTALGGPYMGYYGREGIPVDCSTTSGLTVTISLASASASACVYNSDFFPGTYSAGYLNSTAAGGTCTLIASQSGDSVYAAAPAVTLSCVFIAMSLPPAPSGRASSSPFLTATGSRIASFWGTRTSSTTGASTPSLLASRCSTATDLASLTSSASLCLSASSTATPADATQSPNPSPSSSSSTSSTSSSSNTLTVSGSVSLTPSASSSHSTTSSPSGSLLSTASSSATGAWSQTGSMCSSGSWSVSRTGSQSGSGSISVYETQTGSQSRSGTLSLCETQTDSQSRSGSLSACETQTGTLSRSGTLSACETQTDGQSRSGSLSACETQTGTLSRSGTLSARETQTDGQSRSGSLSACETQTGTLSRSGTLSARETQTEGQSRSGSLSACETHTGSLSRSGALSACASSTSTRSSTGSGTRSGSGCSSNTGSPLQSASPFSTSSPSQCPTTSATGSLSRPLSLSPSSSPCSAASLTTSTSPSASCSPSVTASATPSVMPSATPSLSASAVVGIAFTAALLAVALLLLAWRYRLSQMHKAKLEPPHPPAYKPEADLVVAQAPLEGLGTAGVMEAEDASTAVAAASAAYAEARVRQAETVRAENLVFARALAAAAQAEPEKTRVDSANAAAAHQLRQLEEAAVVLRCRELASSPRVAAASATAAAAAAAAATTAAAAIAAAVPTAAAPSTPPLPLTPAARHLSAAQAWMHSLPRDLGSSLTITLAALQRLQGCIAQLRTRLLCSEGGGLAALGCGAHTALLGLLPQLARLAGASAQAQEALALARADLQLVGVARQSLQLAQQQSLAEVQPEQAAAAAAAAGEGRAVGPPSPGVRGFLAEEARLLSECSRAALRTATAEQVTALAAECTQAMLGALTIFSQMGGGAGDALVASGAGSAVEAACAAFVMPHRVVMPLVDGLPLSAALSPKEG